MATKKTKRVCDLPTFVEFMPNGRADPKSWRNVEALLKWANVEIQRNEFSGHDEVDGERLTEDVLIRLVDLAHKNDLRVNDQFLQLRLQATALENRYHPVREYFDTLQWDGEPRLDKWLHRYLGAKDGRYEAAVGSATLIAAVRRIRRPGTKFDTMLVLEGSQGTGKTTTLEVLSVRKEWFTNNFTLSQDSKKIIEQTSGKMIIEVPELTGLGKSDVEHVKALVSRTVDSARKAYGRLTSEVPRQFVLISTTNIEKDGSASYLKDRTGNRRFWPVRTGEIDLVSLRRDRRQLWAEASHREAAKEAIELPQDLWEIAERRQNRRMERCAYFEALQDRLDGVAGRVTPEDIYQWLRLPPSHRKPEDQSRIGLAMRRLGFEHTRVRLNGKRTYCYVRGDSAERILL